MKEPEETEDTETNMKKKTARNRMKWEFVWKEREEMGRNGKEREEMG